MQVFEAEGLEIISSWSWEDRIQEINKYRVLGPMRSFTGSAQKSMGKLKDLNSVEGMNEQRDFSKEGQCQLTQISQRNAKHQIAT